MIVPLGPGKRRVKEEKFTVAESLEFQHSDLLMSTSCSSEYQLVSAFELKPVIMLADSVGSCFLPDDEMIAPIVKMAYNYEWMAKDIVEGVVNIQRYKNIVIWAGAHSIHHIDLAQVERDLKGLINVITPRNKKAVVSISTLIPKPRENHLTAPKFQRYNDAIKNVVLEFQKGGQEVFCLRSDRVFLDTDKDIVRPIMDNFEDGFHLNRNGADKLKQFWIKNLNNVDYVWRL